MIFNYKLTWEWGRTVWLILSQDSVAKYPHPHQQNMFYWTVFCQTSCKSLTTKPSYLEQGLYGLAKIIWWRKWIDHQNMHVIDNWF